MRSLLYTIPAGPVSGPESPAVYLVLFLRVLLRVFRLLVRQST